MADEPTTVTLDNAYVIAPERAEVKPAVETLSTRVASVDNTTTVTLDNAYVVAPEQGEARPSVETIAVRVASAITGHQVTLDNAYAVTPERGDVRPALETISLRLATKPTPQIELSAVRIQVIQQAPGELPIRKGPNGFDLFYQLLKAATNTTLSVDLHTFARPTQVTGRLSKVKITAKEFSDFRSSIEVTYNRYSINAFDNLIVPDGGWASLEAFLYYVSVELGYNVLDEDLDFTKSVVKPDGTVNIYPAKGSWLFAPDGFYDSSSLIKVDTLLPNLNTQSFDTTPSLTGAIVHAELSGFTAVTEG